MITLLAGGNVLTLPFENQFLLWLQSLGGRFSLLYYVMNLFSFMGESVFIALLLIVVYFAVDKYKARQICFTLCPSLLTTTFIKDLVCRARPFNSGVGIENFRNVGGYSFPSGHSTNAAATYGGTAIAFHDKRRKWLTVVCIALPLLVALSRNYVGAHYPSDVIAGLAIGTAFAFGIAKLFAVVNNKYYIYGGALAVFAVGLFFATDSNYFTMYGLMCGLFAAFVFDDKVAKFETTKVWWRVILRIVGALLVMLLLDTLIKLPFNNMLYYTTARPQEELDAMYRGANAFDKFFLDLQGLKTIKHVYSDMRVAERIFRTIRYAVISFVVAGIYPMLFAPTEKLWKKLGWIKADAETTATTV